ncbi:kelch repeat-containing protein [Brevibacillus sp. FSL K6-0770]|uniref:Kelch repeat-containing protein n=1 Tax=Brevibacillus sp. FSL K6-0770 TaxID=2954673 RepID=UPI0030F917DF
MGPGAAILPDGRVLVVGGDPAGNPDKIWKTTTIYDPDSDSWEPGEPMSIERFKPFAVALADGRVLVAGGWGTVSALVYDPEKDSWAETASLPKKIFEAMGALLPDGRVLLAGGQTSKSEKATLFYQPQLQIRLLFSEAARLQVDRQDVLQNLSYSIDGGAYQAFGEEDRVVVSEEHLDITLDIVPKGSNIRIKLTAGIFADEAGNENEEAITGSLVYN